MSTKKLQVIGLKGKTGDPGKDGVGISSIEQTIASEESGGENILTINLSNGKKYEVKILNGKQGNPGTTGPQGPAGEKGDKGDIPTKGEDYFTEADKQAFVTDVINALPTWQGGVY